MAQKPRLPVSTAGVQSSIVSYSQSQLSASLPWLVTAHHRELPYMPAWLVPGSIHSAAATATANVSLTGRIFTRGSLRRRLCERQTGGLGVVPRNKCRPRPENDARMRGFRTFCLLLCSLFVLVSSSRTYPEYRPVIRCGEERLNACSTCIFVYALGQKPSRRSGRIASFAVSASGVAANFVRQAFFRPCRT